METLKLFPFLPDGELWQKECSGLCAMTPFSLPRDKAKICFPGNKLVSLGSMTLVQEGLELLNKRKF
jgi:hypothetical protein